MSDADPLFFRKYLHYVLLNLGRVTALSYSYSLHYALAVRINDYCRRAVDLDDNEVRDLPADARNLHKEIDIVRNFAFPFSGHLLRKSHYRLGLGSRKTAGLDDRRDRFRIFICDRFHVRILSEKICCSYINPFVGALCGQYASNG